MDCAASDWPCHLARIADSLEGFDLNGFLNTLLATVIGAGVAAAVSFWLANRERPAPVWVFETSDLADKPSKDGTASVKVTLTNVGDGAAYGVRLSIPGSSRWAPTSAVVEPGGILTTWVDVPMTGEYEYDIPDATITDTRVIVWGKQTARVDWRQPPRRNHERTMVTGLREPKH